jgi:ubiquinone/menaquinone biosynthesis C-methylase UbiE
VARKFFHIPKEKRKKIKVLELGCGGGNNAKFLAENGFDVYGIDGSRSAIEICKERFKEWNLKGNFIQGDFLSLPYRNNFFDLVIDRESLYANKFKDIKKAVNEVYKKLKVGGLFISFIYSSYHPDREFGKEIELNTYNNFRKGSFYKAGKAHFTDIKEILELFSNFKIENIIRHSLNEVYNKPQRFMEFDEYIIIAKK